MDEGGLVPDDIMIGIVEPSGSAKPDARTRGYILDGFPRTVPQAEALVEITDEQPIHLVDRPRGAPPAGAGAPRRPAGVPGLRDELHGDRARERMPWFCDVCGGDVVQRTDDTEEAINRRLDLYESQTRPLVEYYEQGRPARDRRRHRRARRGDRRRVITAIDRRPRVPGAVKGAIPRRSPAELRSMRAAGRVVAEMHEPHPGRHPPRGHHRRRWTASDGRCSSVGAPRPTSSATTATRRSSARRSTTWSCTASLARPSAWTRATSCPSTAGPSSTAGTATPPSPPGWGRSAPRPSAWSTVAEAALVAAIDAMVPGNRVGRRRSRRGGGHRAGRRARRAAGLLRPRDRPGHARVARRAQLRAAGSGAEAGARGGAGGGADGGGGLDDGRGAGRRLERASPATGAGRPTPSTPSPSPTTGPRSLTAP